MKAIDVVDGLDEGAGLRGGRDGGKTISEKRNICYTPTR